jgi:hypothetical protein
VTDGTKNRLDDLKAFSIVFGITVTVGGGGVGAVVWSTTLQTKEAARAQHEKLQAVDGELRKKTEGIREDVKAIARDVRTIKCLITATTSKEKARCGLE